MMPKKTNFSLDISNFAKKTGLNIDTVVRRFTLEIFSDVILLTPVDTGRARGSWTVGAYTLPAAYNDGEDKSGSEAIGKATTAVLGSDPGRSVFLASNLIYMPPLEYGSSQKAPRGMVRITLAKAQQTIDGVVKEVVR